MQPLTIGPGDTFGQWVVVGVGEAYVDARGWRQPRWLCRCSCGTERSVWGSALAKGKSTSCGCTRNAGLRKAGVLRRQDVISYFGVHRRLTRDRGKASAHACVDCSERAWSWSYDGTDPNELYYDPPGKRRLAYSLNPARYAPRCRSCHNLHDGVEPPPETRKRKGC